MYDWQLRRAGVVLRTPRSRSWQKTTGATANDPYILTFDSTDSTSLRGVLPVIPGLKEHQ